jgi:hypothetical protein
MTDFLYSTLLRKITFTEFLLTGSCIIFGWFSRFQVFVIATSPHVVFTHGAMYWILLAARKLAAGLKRVMNPVIRVDNLTESGT